MKENFGNGRLLLPPRLPFHLLCVTYVFPTEYLYPAAASQYLFLMYTHHTYINTSIPYQSLLFREPNKHTVSSEVSRKLQFIICCLVFRTRCLTQDVGNDGDDDADEEKIPTIYTKCCVPPTTGLYEVHFAKVIRH